MCLRGSDLVYQDYTYIQQPAGQVGRRENNGGEATAGSKNKKWECNTHAIKKKIYVLIILNQAV